MNKLILIPLIFTLFSCGGNEVREYWNNGELKLIGNQKDGKRIGKWIKFSANKDTMEVQYYQVGELVMLDEYGHRGDSATEATLISRSNYKGSKLHGAQLLFYPSGPLDRKGQFENGIRIDTFFYYREDGFLHQFSVFENGTITTQHQYWPNGNLFLKTNNFMNGVHYTYDSLGTTEYVLKVEPEETSYSVDTLEINTR
jgi:antitoxin component YwqK of YwqJK toxin-antitoxin module